MNVIHQPIRVFLSILSLSCLDYMKAANGWCGRLVWLTSGHSHSPNIFDKINHAKRGNKGSENKGQTNELIKGKWYDPHSINYLEETNAALHSEHSKIAINFLKRNTVKKKKRKTCLCYVENLSRGLCFPRVKSILILLTATSSSLSVTPVAFCKDKKPSVWDGSQNG